MAITLHTACKPRSYNDVSADSGVGSTSMSSLRSTPQEFTIQAGQDVIFNAAQGTTLHFYNNSFKDADGNIITKGTIDMKIVEMYKAGDMIRNNASTMAGGEILQSAGQISMDASMNGRPVTANVYGVGFKHTAASTQPMALFYGNTNNASGVATWTQSDTTKKGAISSAPFKSQYYFDSCKEFKWANSDWFYYNSATKVAVDVILPDSTFNASNTAIYLVLPNVAMGATTPGTFTAVLSNVEKYMGSGSYIASTNTLKLISEGRTAIVPFGLNYQLVVIATKKNSYYYYQQSGVIPPSGLTASPDLKMCTSQQVLDQLHKL